MPETSITKGAKKPRRDMSTQRGQRPVALQKLTVDSCKSGQELCVCPKAGQGDGLQHREQQRPFKGILGRE